MLPIEKNYDFRKRLAVVHKPGLRLSGMTPLDTELCLDSNWCIAIDADATDLARRGVRDFQDYLWTSMNLSLPLVTLSPGDSPSEHTIHCTLKDGDGKKNSCRICVSRQGIALQGADERGLFRALLSLEDDMNLKGLPALPLGERTFHQLPRMRSIHSGAGVDDFPNEQLNAIAHAGFTAIELFVKGPDETAKGTVPVNDIIDRANSYGLDVILYSYMRSYKHPDDADADEFFDSVYGEILRRHPGFAGVLLVGESLDFPSKDPHVCKAYEVDGIHSTKPMAGWYPCCDYPAYIAKVCQALRKVKPDIEIIFNTYNWGYLPADVRRSFLEKLPAGMTLQITYDIFKKIDQGDDLAHPLMDYSISAALPGEYFISEVENARALGLRHLRTTSNLAGATWDFGTVPYVPVPQRWAIRMKTLRHYLEQYDVDSFYDNHHYGWWPNPCIDLAKAIFADGPVPDTDALLLQVARRDYGTQAAQAVVSAWQTWSDAMDYYVGSNEDQYGPWRTGPAYPFIFQPNISRCMQNQEIKFPASPRAHFGSGIIKTFYTPYENCNQSPGPLRMPREIQRLKKMLLLWNQGLDCLRQAIPQMPAEKKENGEFLYGLGKFIRNSILTTIHIKQFWIANIQLQACGERRPMLDKLDEIEAIAQEEIQNVKDTFDCVRQDSRLGWEPSMEYVCDEWHLDWKLRQMDNMLDNVSEYRKMAML